MFYIKPLPKTASFKRFLRHILHAFLQFLLTAKSMKQKKREEKTMNFRVLSFLLLVATLILSVSFVAAKTMRPDVGPRDPCPECGPHQPPSGSGKTTPICGWWNPNCWCEYLACSVQNHFLNPTHFAIGHEGNP